MTLRYLLMPSDPTIFRTLPIHPDYLYYIRCGSMYRSSLNVYCLSSSQARVEILLLSFPDFLSAPTFPLLSRASAFMSASSSVSSRISELVWGHQWALTFCWKVSNTSNLYRISLAEEDLDICFYCSRFHGFVIQSWCWLDRLQIQFRLGGSLPQVPHSLAVPFVSPDPPHAAEQAIYLYSSYWVSWNHPLATVTGLHPQSVWTHFHTGLNPGTSGKKSPVRRT